MEIAEFQELMDTLYGPDDRARGLPSTVAWLCEEMGELAINHDLWLHVDACVGGYILPFFQKLGESFPAYDLSVSGVRSMSADLHKYGYAP